jgi:oligoendopeptidase F
MTPKRSSVNPNDCWNLGKLFPSDVAWYEALSSLTPKTTRFLNYKGQLSQSPQKLKSVLMVWVDLDSLVERVVNYAYLRLQEDLGNAQNQLFYALAMKAQSDYATTCSFLRPELLAMPISTVQTFLDDPDLADYFSFLSNIIRCKHHTLSEKEEALLAGISSIGQLPREIYLALTHADLRFESVNGKSLTLANYQEFLKSPDTNIRALAYQNLFSAYDRHKHSIVALYAGSVKYAFFVAQARGFRDAREAALFDDFIPTSVYDTLLNTVNTAGLPLLHRYYALRTDVLNLHPMAHWDVHAPLVSEVETFYTFEQAIDLICAASKPLGDNYVQVLRQGLLGGWVDRYENRGKYSSNFSSSSYYGDPYILLNYKENSLRSLFALAHEAGHSMLSYYSAKSNPYQHYRASVMLVEVASTLSETLLFEHLLKTTNNPKLQSYLIAQRLDDIVTTLFNQTMFADFEWQAHQSIVLGKTPTLENLRHSYKLLLERYFGGYVALTDLSNLEGLQVSQFYQTFYVYKHATGLVASLVISRNILSGNKTALTNYKEILKVGGSRPPLDSLKLAGVDLMQKQVFYQALNEFDRLRSLLQDNLVKSIACACDCFSQ